MTKTKITILSLLIFFCSHLHSVEFVLFTQPKTGTQLLYPILKELTGKEIYYPEEYMEIKGKTQQNFKDLSSNPCCIFFKDTHSYWSKETMDLVWQECENKNAFLHLHPPYSITLERYLAEKGAITFFVGRDPRDQIISLLNHYKNIDFIDKHVEKISSDEERLLFMIQHRMRHFTLSFKDWTKSPLCCVLDFSKLMGSHGGAATDADAIGELRKIANALQQDLSDESLEQIYQKYFGHGWSFFKGKVGAWKDYFTEPLKDATKKAVGDLLIELGYEKDYNW